MRKLSLVLGVTLVLLLAACTEPTEPTTTPEPITEFNPMVSVTGKVVPAVWTTVGTQTGGMVVEVLVGVGDTVEAGDVLVRFDDTDARLAIQQAETAIAAAQAQVAQLKAGPREEEIAVAEMQIVAANAVISQTQAQYNQLWSGSHEANLAAAEAQIAAAQAEQLVARQTHDDTMKCYDVPQADGSKKEVCPTLGTYEERARFSLNAANKNLAAAEAQLEALKRGFWSEVNNAKVVTAAAETQRAVAQAQLDLLKAGTPPEAIAVAETAVAQAQAALDVAGVALERTEVRAPFAGTIGIVSVRRSEFVAPGQPLVTLGDLATLRVETTDLDEIDVARITEEQDVVITFDAFPDRAFAGRVARIAPMADPGGGGVNYTVIVELGELDPNLRWGMTAFVDIEVQEE